jgi:uncharacterized protein GlcG (DUF336 family)
MRISNLLVLAAIAGSATLSPAPARADCNKLPGHDSLAKSLKEAVKPSGGPSNGGFDLNMWATVVDVDGTVCAVAFSGKAFTDQFLGSRVISAQKAHTANAFSLNGLALSTANLYAPTQPGGSLFGLQEALPVNAAAAYAGEAEKFGTANDPMVGKRIGGVNVFGGGLALYDGEKIGAVGVSGDSSCADHNIAWRVRVSLGLAKVPGGISPNKDDGIIYDISAGASKGGFGHPTCGGKEPEVAKDIASGSVVR